MVTDAPSGDSSIDSTMAGASPVPSVTHTDTQRNRSRGNGSVTEAENGARDSLPSFRCAGRVMRWPPAYSR